MASDIFQPFTGTRAPTPMPLEETTAELATPKKPRRAPNGAGRASRKQSAASTQTPATEPPKKRRGRQPKSAAAAADMGFKIDLLTALAATTSLKGEDTLLFGQMVTALQKQNKKARGRIVDALGKVFG